MKKALFPLVMVVLLILSACASPVGVGTTQPSSSDQVATLVAATMQVFPSNTPAASTSGAPLELLPHTLYYLNYGQIFRMERDGKTVTQITDEPSSVLDYDVSPVDGTLAFIADNQLLLIDADGSNRRVLVDGGPAENHQQIYSPVFSPDGQTLAYAQGGLYLYEVSTGISSLVLADQRTGMGFPVEIYSPVRYSPDGAQLLVALGRWEAPPLHAVYYPDTNALVRIETGQDDLSCCSEHGGPVWSADGSSFYGVAIPLTFCCQTGELWKVDAGNGAVIRPYRMTFESGGTFYLPKELYSAPDGQLYYFFGSYGIDSGFTDAPVLNMARSSSDDITGRTVLREDNFAMMNEALWSPDASLVIVATAPGRFHQDGGVLELYYTDAQKSPVWLAPFGSNIKWGP